MFQVTKACKSNGGFYLGSIGGPAAILAQNCIKKVEQLEYPELGENNLNVSIDFSKLHLSLSILHCMLIKTLQSQH